MAELECFALCHLQGTSFGNFIKELDDIVGCEFVQVGTRESDGQATYKYTDRLPTDEHRANQLEFVKIDTQSLAGYLRHLHHPEGIVDQATGIKGRGSIYSTVTGQLSGMSTAHWQFGEGHVDRAPFNDFMDVWKGEYDKNEGGKVRDPAPAFDMVEDLPRICYAAFNMPGWTDAERVEMWNMVLADLQSLGRGSDVAGDFCPLQKNVKFPRDERKYGNDGLPEHVDIGWLGWKGRKNTSVYPLRMYANKAEGMGYYDIVPWTLLHLSILVKSGKHDPEKPLWERSDRK